MALGKSLSAKAILFRRKNLVFSRKWPSNTKRFTHFSKFFGLIECDDISLLFLVSCLVENSAVINIAAFIKLLQTVQSIVVRATQTFLRRNRVENSKFPGNTPEIRNCESFHEFQQLNIIIVG